MINLKQGIVNLFIGFGNYFDNILYSILPYIKYTAKNILDVKKKISNIKQIAYMNLAFFKIFL